MAAFRRGPVFLTQWMQCRGHKFHTKRRRPIHLERRILESVTAPIIPSQYEVDPATRCSVLQEKQQQVTGVTEDNLYKRFLIRQCREVFQQNSMIVVFQKASMKMEEEKVVKNKLFPSDIHIQKFHFEIVKEALQDTKWVNLGVLLHPFNLYLVSELEKVAELVKITKLLPEVMMLGGVVNGTMYTREGLLRYAALPSMDILCGQTVSILNSAASKTRSLLSSHQEQLARSLDQYVKDQGGNGVDSGQSDTAS